MAPDTPARVRALVARLEALGDPERVAAFERTAPSAMRGLGVRVPDLRPMARALIREHRQAPPAEVHALVFALVEEGSFEARQLGYELLAGHRAALAALSTEQLMALSRGMDNWATVDTWGELILGVSWLRGHVRDELITELAASGDRWERRAALVATVALNKKARGGEGDAARTLPVCRALAADHDDMVVKALSWALRALIAWDRAAVEAFLTERDAALHRRVRREVGNKLRTGLKSG
jgi:3-methyladenine DNA glycosylase AlkD